LLLGTAGYPSPEVLARALAARGAVLTVGLKRHLAGRRQRFVAGLRAHAHGARLLPNTAGCTSAREAIALARMARELYDTPGSSWRWWATNTLQPDPLELVEAARRWRATASTVFPYCTDDLVTCQRLLDAGCPLLMPWGAPIGSGQGLLNPFALRLLRERLPDVVLIVDAGIGAPSHAAQALEMGFDAVLLNSAVSQSPTRCAWPAPSARRSRPAAPRRAGVMARQDLPWPPRR
jgi:thiazole synthase